VEAFFTEAFFADAFFSGGLILDLVNSGPRASSSSIRSLSDLQPVDASEGALWVRLETENERRRLNERTGEDISAPDSEDSGFNKSEAFIQGEPSPTASLQPLCCLSRLSW
jgi:hypothetical protein